MRLSELEQAEYKRYTSKYDFSQFLKNKTVLITGSNGIVGSGLARWLIYENDRKGNNTKIILSSRSPEKIPIYIEEKDNVAFCKFGEEKALKENIDYIIHTASPTSNKVFKNTPVESLCVIIDGTRSVLEYAKNHKECSVIYLSSEEVYGTPILLEPVNESYVGAIDSLSIRNCYPLGKKTAELLCRAYYEEYGVNVKIIRPTVIVGLFQPYDSVKIECEILRCIVENKDLFLKSSGLTKKSVIYTLDAISAVLTVLFKGEPGQAYNATDPETYTTVRNRAESLFNKFQPDLSVFIPEEDTSLAKGYLPQRAFLEDISNIKKLGWKPITPFEVLIKNDIKRLSLMKCAAQQ